MVYYTCFWYTRIYNTISISLFVSFRSDNWGIFYSSCVGLVEYLSCQLADWFGGESGTNLQTHFLPFTIIIFILNLDKNSFKHYI